MIDFPEEPKVSAKQRASAPVAFRYEDVCQDGRLMVSALPQGLGAVVWQRLLVHHPMTAAMRKAGIVPILTHVTLEGGEGPVSVAHAAQVNGSFRLGHTVNEQGEVNRLVLDMWATLNGRRGRTHGPPPEGAGESLFAGRVFGRHVFTRLFAPPAERKVLRFDVPELPTVPPERCDWQSFEGVASLPQGAETLEAEARPDDAPLTFGLCHTDSNQHVNSMVYVRMFEEAALRRFANLGHSSVLLAKRVSIAYRKPFFAGERAEVVLQSFSWRGQLGAVGHFVPEGKREERPHTFVHILF